MRPDYNLVAPVYDFLAKMVFGNSLELAKQANLHHLKQDSRVLIVGGGTGKILEYIDDLGYNMHIDFVELSKAMIKRARLRQTNNISVNFVQSDIIHHRAAEYDAIITNFFFDQFNLIECQQLILHFKEMLIPSGLLLYVDFIRPGRLKDRLILFVMYGFFRFTAKLENVQLIDHKSLFSENKLRTLCSVQTGAFVVSEAHEFMAN